MMSARGCQIDQARIDKALQFIGGMRHAKGRWAGHRFGLLEWELELIHEIFGTIDDRGRRRYRTVYVELPRKNGKSSFAAALALYLLLADGEPGAEIYGAAYDRDQASIVFNIAAGYVRQTPYLAKRLKIIDSQKRIVHYGSGSFYRAIPNDAAGSWGFNAHGIIVDELHVWRSRELWEALTTSTGAREQPLTIIITTAGYDQNSLCYELHDYARQLNEGLIEDPTFYGVIYSAEPEEDWTDPAVWAKANPSYGVIFDEEYLSAECEKAKQVPTYENAFRRLYLNQWTKQEERFIPMFNWDECIGEVKLSELEGKKCYGGLDLASTTDIAAFCLVFPLEDETYAVLPTFWVPEEGILERSRLDRVPYDMWVKQGLIQATAGNVIDYASIRAKIEELGVIYKIKTVAFDRWGATQMVQELEGAGFKMAQFGQGYKDMSPPTKELLNLILSGRLKHFGNKVLRWMADNMVVSMDPAANVKPNKAKSTDRIDGIVATIMALDLAVRQTSRKSVYADRGFASL
jgi:phage terminase large subunit-like protein